MIRSLSKSYSTTKSSTMFPSIPCDWKKIANVILRVVCRTEIKDQKVIKIYERYVEEESGDFDMNKLQVGGEVKPDQKMGYVSSVEDVWFFI